MGDLDSQVFTGQIPIVDGSNIAYCGSHHPELGPLEAMREKLLSSGAKKVITIVDATLFHRLSTGDQKRLDTLLNVGDFYQTPAGTRADGFILRFAQELGGILISNDLFRDFPDFQNRLVIIRSMVISLPNQKNPFIIQFDLDDLQTLVVRSSKNPQNLPHYTAMRAACEAEQQARGVILANNLKPSFLELATDFHQESYGTGRWTDFLHIYELAGIIQIIRPCDGRIEVHWNPE